MNCPRCNGVMITFNNDLLCTKCGFKTPAKVNEGKSSSIQSMNDSTPTNKNNNING